MKNRFLFLLILFLQMGTLNSPIHAETISDTQLIEHIRSALSIPLNWNIQIMDNNPSELQGINRITLQFSMNNQIQKQELYISSDRKHYIIGNIYHSDINLDAMRMSLIDIKNSPMKGTIDAPITLVEFTDLQCPSCKKTHSMIEQEKIIEEYQGKVKFVFKNFPLPNHSWSTPAAIACMCAYDQNKNAFWSMSNNIFEQQPSITLENLNEKILDAAEKSNLNIKKFKDCYDQKKLLPKIQQDMKEGDAIGIRVTPTLMVNGRLFQGPPDAAQLKELINFFLEQKK